jgi:hypothetical protein
MPRHSKDTVGIRCWRGNAKLEMAVMLGNDAPMLSRPNLFRARGVPSVKWCALLEKPCTSQ